ncbi:PIN domain-containing protein [Verrucomicrobium sp. 3C]|uniref:PIN domain-containing protein n=1 Tax=Verrucomicrobium sp. 3C TaxID=1134055 RepID=UPI000379D4DC|nr:PIN domain-containing protein [Verrucomicrobium sp. 3C]
MRVVLLDCEPLGLLIHPQAGDRSRACLQWLHSSLQAGDGVCLPEIADYEIRRELLRRGNQRSLEKLDQLKETIRYLPLTTETMKRAASFWAKARQNGRPTAHDKALDGDMILCAQAVLIRESNGHEVVVATGNVGHLSLFVVAKRWEEIGS